MNYIFEKGLNKRSKINALLSNLSIDFSYNAAVSKKDNVYLS